MNKNIYSVSSVAKGIGMAALLLLAHLAPAQQFITNGDFEAWTGNCPTNTPPDSWTNYSTSLGPDEGGACAGSVTAHGGSSYMNLVWINSGLQEGATHTVQNLTIGVAYRISFWAINSQGLYANPGDCILELHRNSQMVYATPNLASGGAWTQYTYDFTATGPVEPVALRVVPGTTGTSGSVGVDDFSLTPVVGVHPGMRHQVTVFPSPATDVLHVSLGDMGSVSQVPFSISNLVGQQIQRSTVDFQQGRTAMDLATLHAGIYFLTLELDGEQATEKFVVR